MRIFYLSNSTIPSKAANSIQVMRMCSAFADLGHEVILFAGMGQSEVSDVFEFYGSPEKFVLERLPRPNRPIIKSLIYSKNVSNAVRSAGVPDLIYARDPFSLWRVQEHSSPLVYEAHSGPSRFRRFIESQIFSRRNFARLVVISQALKETYKDSFQAQLKSTQIHVAHDAALDESQVPPIELATKHDSLRVGYTGHLYRGKGGEILIGLARMSPQHEFHVVGGTPEDVSRLREVARDCKNLIFHGFLPPCQIAAIRNAMDVLLAPYQANVAGSGGGDISQWMSPLKIFEYMSSGKAIIASDLPVLREVLSDQENCLWVPPADLQRWGQALQQLESVEFRQSLGNKARTDFLQSYTWRKRAEKVLTGLTDAEDTP